MREPVIVDVVRTTFGKSGGALSHWHPTDLLGFTLSSLLERTGVDPERIDDVIGGCVSQVGEQGTNLTRTPGWPPGSPSRFRRRRSIVSAGRRNRPFTSARPALPPATTTWSSCAAPR